MKYLNKSSIYLVANIDMDSVAEDIMNFSLSCWLKNAVACWSVFIILSVSPSVMKNMMENNDSFSNITKRWLWPPNRCIFQAHEPRNLIKLANGKQWWKCVQRNHILDTSKDIQKKKIILIAGLNQVLSLKRQLYSTHKSQVVLSTSICNICERLSHSSVI